MTPIRKEAFFKILYFLLAIVLSIFLLTLDNFLRYSAIIVMTFGFYQFRLFIKMLQPLFDDFFPPKYSKNQKAQPLEKFVNSFAMTLFFVAVVFQICVSWWTQNTIFGLKLVWYSVLIGFIIAVFTTIILKLKRPSIYYDSNRRITVHFGLFLGFCILTPALTIFINHIFANNLVSCKNYTIEEKRKVGRNKGSWLSIKLTIKKKTFILWLTYLTNLNQVDKFSFVRKWEH